MLQIAHTLKERGHDLYETPECAVEALLGAEALPRFCWEPACGRGAIARVLRRRGRHVLATDLVDYGSQGRLARVHVFRSRLPMMHRAGWSGPRASSAIAFAWFVWDRDHAGPAELHRISWR